MEWRLALASAIGTSHLESETLCQDRGAYAFVESRDGQVLILVVADGAGSAKYSDLGAEIASQELIGLVSTHFEADGILPELTRATAEAWISRIAALIANCADRQGHDVRDYACTLLAAILAPDAAAFLQVGDGAIVVSHGEADGWTYVFWPQHGEFANTTNFVVSPNALEALEFDLAPRRIDEVALFTDGIENLVLHQASRSVHEPFFNRMFRPVRNSKEEGLNDVLSEGLKQYLAAPAICERTDDDKTLILATRAGPTASGVPIVGDEVSSREQISSAGGTAAACPT